MTALEKDQLRVCKAELIAALADIFVAVAMLGMVLWGIGMGAQESIMRAAVAGMVPAARRGTAYGVFNSGYGLLWFAGSALMGMLYDVSLPALIAFSVVAQLIAVPVLFLVGRRREVA